jgi:hypothetical protein
MYQLLTQLALSHVRTRDGTTSRAHDDVVTRPSRVSRAHGSAVACTVNRKIDSILRVRLWAELFIYTACTVREPRPRPSPSRRTASAMKAANAQRQGNAHNRMGHMSPGQRQRTRGASIAAIAGHAARHGGRCLSVELRRLACGDISDMQRPGGRRRSLHRNPIVTSSGLKASRLATIGASAYILHIAWRCQQLPCVPCRIHMDRLDASDLHMLGPARTVAPRLWREGRRALLRATHGAPLPAPSTSRSVRMPPPPPPLDALPPEAVRRMGTCDGGGMP